MLVYFVVFGLAVTVSSVAERSWRAKTEASIPRGFSVGALLAGLVLISVSALRWGVGTDYWSYEESFPLFAAEFDERIDIFGEPGFGFIAWLALETSGDAAVMFALSAFLTIVLTVRTLWRWSPAFSFSVAIYIVSGAWHGSFNGVRQYIACSVLFAGHRHILERNFWKWIAVVLVASLFHTSALVGILFYFLATKRTSVRLQILILGLGFMGMIGMDSVLQFVESVTGDSNRWGGSYAAQPVNPLRITFAFIPIFLFWMLKVKKRIEREEAWFYVNMLVVYAATFLAALTSALIARFAIYSMPFLAIALVYVTWVEDRKERLLIRSGVVLLYAVFMFFNVFWTDDLRNFQWIFERP